MLDKQAYILFSAHLKSCEELHDGLIALEVFCENIKDAITKMQNIMEDDYLQHGLLPPKVRWPKDEDDNLPNVIHLHKDEDKEDKDE